MRDCNSLLLRAIIKTTDKDGLSSEEFVRTWSEHPLLFRGGYARMAYCRGDGEHDYLFVNGRDYALSRTHGACLPLLSGKRRLAFEEFSEWLKHAECRELLATLYNGGYFEFDHE